MCAVVISAGKCRGGGSKCPFHGGYRRLRVQALGRGRSIISGGRSVGDRHYGQRTGSENRHKTDMVVNRAARPAVNQEGAR